MKRNKKGFTLVELVIVIAVIAILAGVMIAIFSGVIKRANENAELQQVKNDELKQKAEDVLTKLDNANWFSWEDFENSLAAKLTEAYKKYGADGDKIAEQVEKAVKKAIDEYAANSATSNTSLTETQVKVIVENALANAKLGGVTEEQVRTIVNTAVSGINTVSKADIQRIVDAATAKGLTAEQVSNIIGQSGLAKKSDTTALSEKVDSVITKLNALTPVTKKDVEDAIIDLLPVTKTAADKTEFETLVGRLNSGSTIIVGFDTTDKTLVIGEEAGDKTLIIKGVAIDNLKVTAPKATIYLIADGNEVLVEATAQNSFHVLGKVANLVINKGRVVVEDGATVTTLTALPSRDSLVKVSINEEGTVEKLYAEYQDHKDHTDEEDVTNDYIVIENNGTVGEATITASETLKVSCVTTTNVTITNGANAKGTDVGTGRIGEGTVKVDETVPATIREDVSIGVTYFAGGTGTENDPFLIVDYETFQHVSDYYKQGYFYFKVKDGIKYIDCSNWVPVQLNGSFDGNGVTLNNLNKTLFKTVVNNGDPDEYVTLEDFTINANIQSASVAAALIYAIWDFDNDAKINIDRVDVNGYIESSGGAASYIGYGTFGGSQSVNFNNCVSTAAIVATGDSACGFVKHAGTNYCDKTIDAFSFTDCAFTGSLTGTKNSTNNYFMANVDAYATVTYTEGFFNKYNVSSLYDSAPSTYGCQSHIKISSSSKFMQATAKSTLDKEEINVTSLSLNYGDKFVVSKASEYVDKALVVLQISPNEKNYNHTGKEGGSYTGAYMSETLDLSNNNDETFTTNNIRYFEIEINGSTEVANITLGDSGVSADNKVFNVIRADGAKSHNGALVKIVQYQDGVIVKITNITIANSTTDQINAGN